MFGSVQNKNMSNSNFLTFFLYNLYIYMWVQMIGSVGSSDLGSSDRPPLEIPHDLYLIRYARCPESLGPMEMLLLRRQRWELAVDMLIEQAQSRQLLERLV